jgi:hypothetical protein
MKIAITVGRYGSKLANIRRGRRTMSFAIWSVKKYISYTTKEGKMVWKLSGYLGRTVASNSPSQVLINEGKEYMKDYPGSIWLDHVTQFQKVGK